MTTEQSGTIFAAMARCSRFLARQLVIVSTWLIAVGFFSVACFTSGNRQSWLDWDLVVFTTAFAIAAAFSASMTQLLAGKKRWSFEILLTIGILIAVSVAGVCIALWLAPTLGQGLPGVGASQLLAFQRNLLASPRMFIWQTVPTAVGLGVVIGSIAGLFLLMTARSPRLRRWLFAGVLVVCAVSTVHIGAFGSVTDLIVRYRLHGLSSLEHSWYMQAERASVLGAAVGAIVGATLSWGALWVAGRPRSGRMAGNPVVHPVA
jgi:hypothetical protein